MWAATDIDKVRLLLARGADAKAASQRGRTALLLAASSDRSADDRQPADGRGRRSEGRRRLKSTALHAAAWGNDTETIRLFVDAGAAT